MNNNSRILVKLALSSALVLSTAAVHATTTYSFATGGTASSVAGISNAQRVYSVTNSPTLTVTGFVNTFNAAGDAALTTPGTTSGSQNAEYTYAPIAFHGADAGLGIQFQTSPGVFESAPDHATDNNGNHEFFLLSFSTPVALTDLRLGWPDAGSTRDTDFMVLRFAGNVAGSPTGDGFQAADMLNLNSTPGDTTGPTYGLTAAGWELMGATTVAGNVSLTTDNMPLDTGNAATSTRSIGNTTFRSSSFWLVGARNQWLAAGSDTSPDFGKLLSVTACVPGTAAGQCTPSTGGGNPVPEPTTLSLLGLGLVGAALRRRRAQ